MRRKRILAYQRPPSHFPARLARDKVLSEAELLPPTDRNQHRSLAFNPTFNSSSASVHARSVNIQPGGRPSRVLKAALLRSELQKIVGSSVLLSLSSAVMSFATIELQVQNGVTAWEKVADAAVIVTSVLQVPLIVLYWSRSLTYTEVLRRSGKLSKSPTPKLSKSPEQLFYCILECLFNLAFLPPVPDQCTTLFLFGHINPLCYRVLLYSFLLVRVYHIVRLLYYCSRFSDVRTSMHAHLNSVSSMKQFLFRGYLADFSYKLVLVAYGFMVLIPGLISFLVENDSSARLSSFTEDDLWVIAYTQATIGYGEHSPATFLGRTTVIVSCFAGIFALGLLNRASSEDLQLNLRESDLCSELLLCRLRVKQKPETIELIQAWWRFLRMRQLGVRQAATIVGFYSRLGRFQGLLVARQRVSYGRFEYQIQAFAASVERSVRSLSVYLSPVEDQLELTQDMLRAQLQIVQSAKRLKRMRKVKLRIKQVLSVPLDDVTETSSDGSPSKGSERRKKSAQAKRDAHHNLKLRLLK